MSEQFRQRLDEIVARLDPEFRAAAAAEVAALLATGAGSVEALIEALDRGRGARPTICWLLGRLGDHAALGALRRAATDDDPGVRSEAVRALGELGGDAEVEVLIAVLRDDPAPFVRSTAAAQLGMCTGRRAFDALAAALTRPGEDEEVRSTCAEALGTSEEPDALPLLLDASRDSSSLVRYDAALALGQLGDARALDRLRELVEHDDAELPGVGGVRGIAAEAVASIEARTRPGQRPGESFTDFAARTLDDDLLAHVEYLCELVAELDVGEAAPIQTLDIYPTLWREHDGGHWRIAGPHPDADVSAWARANRRMAARVLVAWRRELELLVPDVARRPLAGWRRGYGVEDWAEGERYQLAIFLADEALGGFSLTLPDDPAPLSDEERRALLSSPASPCRGRRPAG